MEEITYGCKRCGGKLKIVDNNLTIFKCEFCQTLQAIPRLNTKKKLQMFERANRLRSRCEFDTATSVFLNIAAEFPDEAEAYWGLCLCKYGIEYVKEKETVKRIPTCHRTNYTSILDDMDYIQALENASEQAKPLYIKEAEEINGLQKAILAVANKEKPYDVFISFKNEDKKEERTKDSVLAQSIYDTLTERGYAVFFSRISLESSPGEYEPYIFNALNSAKVMLVVGTDYENLNSVWVKNEWSRFLELIKKDSSKEIHVCYADMDPRDLPNEFKNISKHNIHDVGFEQDLLRGISKIIAPNKGVGEEITFTGLDTDNILKRGFLELEDENWEDADRCFDTVLKETPNRSKAYLGKAMAQRQVLRVEHLCRLPDLSENKYFKHAVECGNDSEKKMYANILQDCEKFRETEMKRLNMVRGCLMAEDEKINELNNSITSENARFLSIRYSIRHSNSFLYTYRVIVGIVLVILFLFLEHLIMRQLIPDVGYNGFNFNTVFIYLLVACPLGIGISDIICRRSEKSYGNKRVQMLQDTEKDHEQRISDLYVEIDKVDHSFICCRCGGISESNLGKCEYCDCTQLVQVRQALNMERQEFTNLMTSEKSLPFDHDFMQKTN